MGISKKAIQFVVLTYALSYLLVFSYFLFGGKWQNPSAFFVTIIYMFMPMTAAIVLQKFVYKEKIKKPLGISFIINKWWLVAWLAPVFFAFITLGVSLLLPGIEYSSEMEGMFQRFSSSFTKEQVAEMKRQIETFPVHPIWITVIQGLIAGVTINAVAAFGEELGWRGFLQKEFSDLGFWKASIAIGVVWGFWHAPIILQGHNYPQHPLIGVFMMTLFTLLLSPLFTFITVKAKSVIAAAITHGTMNATGGIAIILIKGGTDLTAGITGLAGLLTLLAMNIVLFLYIKEGKELKLSFK